MPKIEKRWNSKSRATKSTKEGENLINFDPLISADVTWVNNCLGRASPCRHQHWSGKSNKITHFLWWENHNIVVMSYCKIDIDNLWQLFALSSSSILSCLSSMFNVVHCFKFTRESILTIFPISIILAASQPNKNRECNITDRFVRFNILKLISRKSSNWQKIFFRALFSSFVSMVSSVKKISALRVVLISIKDINLLFFVAKAGAIL